MLLVLLLPLTFAVADVPRVDTQAGHDIYFVADLAPADARSLVGKRARYRVVLDSAEDLIDHSWDCLAPDGLHATVYLRPDQEEADVMTVEARLVIIDHPAGFGFPPLREYRLRDAACGSGGELTATPGASCAILGHKRMLKMAGLAVAVLGATM
jgi:hypothetical protein